MNIVLGIIGQILMFFVLTSYMLLALIPSILVYRMPVKKRNLIVGPIWILLSKIIVFFSWSKPLVRDRRSQYKNQPCPPGVVISNHLSMFDIPLIYSNICVPPIMKKEVLRIPIFGFLGKLAGALPVDRKDPNSRKAVLFQAIKRILDFDFGILYFPEGTRSRIGSPKDFDQIKTKILQIAYKNSVSVFPLSVYGTTKVLGPVGNIIARQNIGLLIHEKVDPKNFSNEEEFIRCCWEKVVNGYHELKKDISEKNPTNQSNLSRLDKVNYS